MTTRIGHTLTLKKKRGVLVSHGHCAYGHGPWLLQRGTLVSLALDRGTGSSSELELGLQNINFSLKFLMFRDIVS